MPEPIYIAQCGEPLTQEQRRTWVQDRCAEARSEGCQFFRATFHPTIENLILLEGWAEEYVTDQGKPRWQFAAEGADNADR